MMGHFQLYNNSIFRIFITVVTVVTVATVKFPLSYCRDSNLEDSSTKSTDSLNGNFFDQSRQIEDFSL